MIIEIATLASSVTTIGKSVSTAIKAGRDVGDLLPHFGKLAQLGVDINMAENGKHKGPLGRLSSPEAEGLQISQAKIAHKAAMDDLRTICSINGQWGLVQSEMAAARKRHKEAQELAAKQRDQLFWGLSLTAGVLVFIAGTAAMIWGLNEAVNG